MNMKIFYAFLCGLFAFVVCEDVKYLSKVDQLRYDFLKSESKLWRFVNKVKNGGLSENDHQEVELLKRIKKHGDRIQKLSNDDISMPYLDGSWAWALTYSDLRGIYALYESFRNFENSQAQPDRVPDPKQAWVDIANEVIFKPKYNINKSMSRIYDMVINKDLYKDVLTEVKIMNCTQKTSPQFTLYQLYNNIALTELKGYIMMQTSLMLLKLFDKETGDNFSKDAESIRKLYKERTITEVQKAKNYMYIASNQYLKCDPQVRALGDTHLEITQLLQGYIQNEVDLNPDGTCRENCAEYQYTRSYGCFQNLFCRQQRRCNGRILNCKYIDSDMKICSADASSGRRYESIEYENGLVYGRKMSCRRGETKVDSWWRWLFWHCSYCLCLCDEQGPNSDRYINMRPSIADVKNNRVVTGLRFVKKNRLIHLQIQQGELLPFGNINPDTIEWVSPDNYKINDKRIYAGVDYHVLTWENRAIDLDDLYADKGQVVIGVKFKEIGSHLNLEILVAPFNFTSGALIRPLEKGIWKDNANTDVSYPKPRTKVHLIHPDIPTRAASSRPMSHHDQYVEFVNSDFERDAAQTTVPFIDAQRVESAKPTPLSGAGIYLKGDYGFGGFIAPKIITYDFVSHVDSAIPDSDTDEVTNTVLIPSVA